MFRFAFLVSLFLNSFPFAAEAVTVTGTVVSSTGVPIHNAVISIEQLKISANTDQNGAFSLTLPEGIFTLIVEAPGYQTTGETITAKKAIHLPVVLHPQVLQFEEIVMGRTESVSSVSSPSNTIEQQSSPASLLESVKDTPSVAPLGQGGLFQVPSIRGAARERTLLLFESVKITSDRRTGPSFSFVDPIFLERIQVHRGPAPVLYGSNGETGLIQASALEPAAGRSTTVHVGYETNSAENWQGFSFKDGTQSFHYVLGMVRRDSGDYRAASGEEYPSGYTRYNLLAKARWFTQNGVLTLLFLPSVTEDIDKASIDHQTRPTIYPRETHQVYFADWQNSLFEGFYDMQVQGWYHPSSLQTRDMRLQNGMITQKSEVRNETDDFGVHFRLGKDVWGDWKLWSGAALFGRFDVDAYQKRFVAGPTGLVVAEEFFSIKDGTRKELGVFLSGSGSLGKLKANTGIRLNRVSMDNQADTREGTTGYNWTAFLGGAYPLSSAWDVVLNLGRGTRPATLSEKFFTGETGRGSIRGNPGLLEESNWEVDGGIRYRHSNSLAAIYVFRNSLFDYIQRVEIEQDQFTFANEPEVTIYGIEGEGFVRWDGFHLYGNFHKIQGHDGRSNDIDDIPPSRFVLGIEYRRPEKWSNSIEVVRQFGKSDPGPTEKAIGAALLVHLKSKIVFSPHFRLDVGLANLTNRNYFPSADEKAPNASGRSIDLELTVEF